MTEQLTADINLPLGRFPLQVNIKTESHMTGLFGPSGSGKTSFLEVVAGLRQSAVGSVVLGQTVWQDSNRKLFVPTEKRGIGYVPQEGLLFPHLTAQQNLRYARRGKSDSYADPKMTLRNVIELLELGALLDQYPETLSGGERQRVALGRALCSRPKILLLDEPLAALDEALRHKILPFIRRIRDEFAIPMILVSHDSMEVQALCDDLLLLDHGELVARGDPRKILIDTRAASSNGGRGFDNVIPCSTKDREDDLTIVQLGGPDSGITLQLFSRQASNSKSRYVSIPARDIILATSKPEGLSARNIHPGRIESIQNSNYFSLVSVGLGFNIPPLVAEVTASGCNDLSLRPGMDIFVVIKSMACTLYEEHLRDDQSID